MHKWRYRFIFLHRIYPFGKDVKVFYVTNLCVSMLIMLSSFITPLLYKEFINKVILNKHLYIIGRIVFGYISLFLATALLKFIKQYVNNRVVNHVMFRAKYKIWTDLFSRPFPAYDKLNVGDIKMRLDDDMLQISDILGRQSIDSVIQIMTMAVSVVMLFVISWQLSVFSILSIPLTFLLDHIISKKEKELNTIGRENEQNTTAWLYESIRGWKEIRALNLQKRQNYQFIRFAHEYALYFGEWINYWVLRVLIMPKIKDQFLMQFGLYFLGGLLIINGNLKIGNFLVFVLYYGILSDAMNFVSTADAELQSAMPHTQRLIEELGQKKDQHETCVIVIQDIQSIVFKNVHFCYPGTEIEVLKDLNFQILKGERVAIAGKSGSGKTTVLKLLLGMLVPTEGVVEISGTAVSEICLDKLYRRIGVIMQENMLLNTTIRENLRYGKVDANETEIWKACDKAYIKDFIEKLPEGLDTVIGERGVKLSGGQKQRIVLARLFLKDVEVYIFDEATSALDQYSESIIHDAIEKIGRDKTIIIVAHRESSIKLCDRVINL